MPVDAVAYAVYHPDGPLKPFKYQVRDPGEGEILVEVLFCSICQSDINCARQCYEDPTFFVPEEKYPVVVGHEITGICAAVGPGVTKVAIGDRIGVGPIVNSCKECNACKDGFQNYCKRGPDWTYPYDHKGNVNYGGYGTHLIAHEDCILHIPDNLPMDRAAPLMCAGIRAFGYCISTNIRLGNQRVGVIGLGCMGHMVLQWAASYPGNEVYVYTHTPSKREVAMQLGATDVILYTDRKEMKKYVGKLDFMICTVDAKKPLAQLLDCLNKEGRFIHIGSPPDQDPSTLECMSMLQHRVFKSGTGGIEITQIMLNYAAEKNILPHIELISCDYVGKAWERVRNSDVKFRFVMDIKNTHPKL